MLPCNEPDWLAIDRIPISTDFDNSQIYQYINWIQLYLWKFIMVRALIDHKHYWQPAGLKSKFKNSVVTLSSWPSQLIEYHMHLVDLLLNVQHSSILRSSTLKIHYSCSRWDTLLTTAAPDGIHTNNVMDVKVHCACTLQ